MKPNNSMVILFEFSNGDFTDCQDCITTRPADAMLASNCGQDNWKRMFILSWPEMALTAEISRAKWEQRCKPQTTLKWRRNHIQVSNETKKILQEHAEQEHALSLSQFLHKWELEFKKLFHIRIGYHAKEWGATKNEYLAITLNLYSFITNTFPKPGPRGLKTKGKLPTNYTKFDRVYKVRGHAETAQRMNLQSARLMTMHTK
jgi:hypothetical protein